MIYSFEKQLKKGKWYESKFLELFDDIEYNTTNNAKNVDFIITGTKILLELKTDERAYQTNNIFLELYSDHSNEVFGGLIQAFEKGANVVVYAFPNLNYLIFINLNMESIKSFIDLTNLLELKMIKNPSWVTSGYAVNLEKFKIYMKKHIEIVLLDEIFPLVK